MKVGSLFSGIGGLDLGLERAGMEIVWQVENDPYCRKVLRKHWPEVLLLGDVKEIDFKTLPIVDLICGGFPCQPVSCAGKRRGKEDERWLWPEFHRAIRETRPQWVLVENVPGLLSIEDGRLFAGILGDLAASGYDAEWDMLCANQFGVPQKRERVFLIASSTQFNQCAIFYQNTLHVKGHQKGLDVFNRDTTDSYHENNRKGTLSILGNPNGAEIPYGERSGTDDGFPDRLDRLKCLGNAVVPQVAEWIGKRIMENENEFYK